MQLSVQFGMTFACIISELLRMNLTIIIYKLFFKLARYVLVYR
jgi:hypothetical protein